MYTWSKCVLCYLLDSVLKMSIRATWLVMFKSPLIFYLLVLSSIGKGILNLISNFNVCRLLIPSLLYIFEVLKLDTQTFKMYASFFFFFFKFLKISLAVSGLSCGTQDLCWILWDLSLQLWCSGSTVAVLRLQSTGLSCSVARGILVPQAGMAPVSPALQGKFLTTRLRE